jgi:hypothetical protein
MDPDPAIFAIDLQDASKKLTSKMPAKNNFSTQFFLLVTFGRYIYIIFKR